MRRLTFVLFTSFLSGCATETVSTGCASDTECDPGFFCQEGSCRCRTDDACGDPAKFHCNSFGACQARPACLGNQDCGDNEICNSSDPSGGKCIPATQCGSSVHCEFGEYCSPSTQMCEPGCRNTGDCQLGYVCAGGSCVSGGTASDCNICPTSPEPDASYCDFGEVCTASGNCQSHATQADLCTVCGGLLDPPCADDTLCLIDNDVAGAQYCAPLCDTDDECPGGYEKSGCGKVTLVIESCTGPGTCSNGAVCLGDPESAEAFCGCISDDECSLFPPSCLFGQCSNSGMPCDNADDCGVSCVEFTLGDGTTAGVCLTDRGVCGKNQGMLCGELTTGTAECRNLY